MAGNAATVFAQLYTQIHREMWCQIGQLKELWCRSLLECSLLLSRLYTPLSLPLSFFLLFSLQFLTAGRSTGQNKPVYGAKKDFSNCHWKKMMRHESWWKLHNFTSNMLQMKMRCSIFANKSFICVKKGLPQNEHSVIIYSSQLCDFLLWNKK